MIVLKFGGTSVAEAKRIKEVAEIVKEVHGNNKKTAVVFSAFGGVTDDLINAARLAAERNKDYLEAFEKIKIRHRKTIADLKISGDKSLEKFLENSFTELHDLLHGLFLVKELSLRMLDIISGFGELLSARVISAYFSSQKIPAAFLDARQVITTDEHFGSALVDFTATNKNIKQFFRNFSGIACITGFIASTDKGESTTLGRGGSDYSAAIFGAALDADEIQIWTDVDGVMTADPRKVKKAFTVSSMTYEEAMEMSHFGAKVIHPPTIQPALEKEIPLRIKNTFNPASAGTLISAGITDQQFMIKGISSIDDIALLTLQGSGMVGVAGISARLFGALSQSKVNVILITQGSSEHTISFAVKPADAVIARKAIDEAFDLEIKAHMIEKVKVEENLSVIAVIGENMRNTPGVSGRLFQSFGKNGISAVATAQGSSELNISVVIHRADLNKALNALHQAFFLSDTRTLNIFMVGTGLIGTTLLQQIEKQAAHLKRSSSVEITLVAVSNSRKMFFDENGISTKKFKEQLEKGGEKMSIAAFIIKMISLNLPQSIFVDCTSSEDVVKHYETVLNHSISIVTPNKIANSGKLSDYVKLRDASKKRNVRFLYETNVGAGLPVIGTLKDLMSSGDSILKIEAVLSGTLSFIFNNFKAGTNFSDIVHEAHRRGYTEPDPRVDLSGKDVARKLLILARETGLNIEMNDIVIEQILPANCRKAKTVEEFFEELQKSNDFFDDRRKKTDARKKVLRFIAKLEKNEATISLQEVDHLHPFYNLSGSDNIISYTTERYHERPLVVKGPGAGAEVTAAGVFAEIISIGNYFE